LSLRVGGFKLRMSLVLGAFLVVGASPVARAQDFVPGEVIVKYKTSQPGKVGALSVQGAVMKMQEADDRLEVKATYEAMGVAHLSKPGQDVQATIRQLEANPDVEYAEPNYVVHALGASANEAGVVEILSEAQADAHTSACTFALTCTDWFGVLSSWTRITAGLTNKPIVAVIDTGVKLTHSKLSNALWVNASEQAGTAGLDNDGNGYVDDINGWNFNDGNSNPDDCNGHGTHVAGIVRGMTQDLAAGDSSTPLIQIMPLKFLNCSGAGSTSNAIAAIYYAVNKGAKVLNNSWGGGGYSRSLNEAIAYSYSGNALFVAAAGNYSTNNNSTAMYPANYDVPNVLSVAATDDYDALAYFSNYGNSTVHIGAPGVLIYSTYIPNTYATLNGTSMAAPMVSGLAALMSRERPTMTGYQLKNIILGAGDVVAGLAAYTTTSRRLNADVSMTTAKTASLYTSVPGYTMSISSADRGTANALGGAGATGCGTVRALGSGGGSGFGSGAAAVIALLMIPVLVVLYLRHQDPVRARARRQFERFHMSSDLTIRVGGQELVARMSTISQGGVGFSTNAMLERGSVVSMVLKSPDGVEQVHVDGEVVWKDAEQAYGVQFAQVTDGVMGAIRRWSNLLAKAS
jgi:hypothetical protein